MTLLQLSSKIKSLRKEQNYSQGEIQQFSNITKRTISKMENGFADEVGIKKVETIYQNIFYKMVMDI